MKEFRKCPNCGYKRGFHVSFRKEESIYDIILICPSCGAAYDLNFKTSSISDLEFKKINTYEE